MIDRQRSIQALESFRGEAHLEEVLSLPSGETVELLGSLEGDFLVLGAGGKVGPTLCRLLRNALAEVGSQARVYAVSRFSDPRAQEKLEAAGIATIRADLLDRGALSGLPRAANVYFLAGMKFGAGAGEELTWAMNTYLPGLVAEHCIRARTRIVVFSTGNVYPFVEADSGGATEEITPEPVGEYAMSCLGRERIFQHFSRTCGTGVAIARLNYANEPRYGIIVDVAQKVLAGEPVDLSMGYVNLIWQGDACDYIARALSLASSPAAVLNVAGPQTVSVRELAERIGKLAEREVHFSGREQPTALLSDASRCFELFGPPAVSLDRMLGWIVDWLSRGNRTLNKPTKFQVRDGRF